ncbi:MAG: hypothetical protein CM15mL6_140 [uncultured marine virus]|nr:MAG: hypothetical protein CM15mL6_140 [uncultured marine virus]
MLMGPLTMYTYNDIIDGDNIQTMLLIQNVAGSIDHEHLAHDIIDGDKYTRRCSQH